METKARVIAIYLPQYHPIPENDGVWGPGFTEWVNVAQARPLFKRHYQPRIPRDLGFYDLRLPEIREAQAKMAFDAGIEGFMYWQYYMGKGKMLLERPFEEVLHSGKPDFPFCLGWANHSWQTKTWKRNTTMKEGRTMIVEQRYDGEEQYRHHFMYNLAAFKDSRYIMVDGKPLFAIWNPTDKKDEIMKFMCVWRKLALENGLKGIHFVGGCNSMKTKSNVLFEMGFDAVYESNVLSAVNGGTHWTLWHRITNFIEEKTGKQLVLNKNDFAKVYNLLVTNEAFQQNVYPTLVAGYDRSPRAGRKAQILYNFTPDTWRLHIRDVLRHVYHKDSEHNIIMLKSWNEWGESNYMEPDLRYGSAMLDTLRDELIVK